MFKLKNATVHLNSIVLTIEKVGSGFELKLESGKTSCDAVVVAAPFEQSDLKLPEVSVNIIRRQYHLTQTTFVSGLIKPAFFGKKTKVPDAIYTIESPNVEFNSIGCYTPEKSENNSHLKFSNVSFRE